jgi:hypothetical protein
MQRNCDACGLLYEAKRPSSKYHNDTCRKRAQRSPSQATKPSVRVAHLPAGLESVTMRELETAGRLDTVLGQAALVLARRLESPHETGASVASMSKQLRETLVDALKGARQVADPLDEIRARRDSKRLTG